MARWLAFFLIMLIVACGGELFHPEDDAASTTNDAATDAGDESDAIAFDATADAVDAVSPYHDMTQSSFWSAHNDLNATPSWGAVFDGRYFYRVPTLNNGVVSRYDTQSDFTDEASWSTFDTTTLSNGVAGYAGATFDGRYVYFVPNATNGGTVGLVVRYDTTAPFTTATSWSMFDLAMVNAKAVSFQSATFDGRFIYLVPFFNGSFVGLVVRYDTTALFESAASWSTFDVTTIDKNAQGFVGAVFDGRYVYFSPHFTSVVARYDTTASFVDAQAWSTFDVKSVDANANAFQGAGFDDRYVYFAPMLGHAARYDTKAAFTSSAAWSTFDPNKAISKANGFFGTVYDGRYLYMVGDPVARFDTTAVSFTDPKAWSSFDLQTLGCSASVGGVFDGRFVYLSSQCVARFDARDPALMPKLPAWYGSFF